MSAPPALPPRVHLPSGRVVDLVAAAEPARAPHAPGTPLFSEVLALGTDVHVTEGGAAVDLGALELGDFHTLRAILTRSGFLHEDALPIPCVNCEAELSVTPCALLEIGPYVDGELDDPELDRTLAPGEPVALSGDLDVVFAKVTATAALPLLGALGANTREFPQITREIALAMGVARLGDETDPEAIAASLADLSDDLFAELAAAWLRVHYPARLFGVALCPDCGAANHVDAPYERELDPPERPPSPEEPFPDPETFAARCEEAFALSEESIPGERVMLVVEDGPAACDDAGVPLLGAYLPPDAGGGGAHARPPTVTIYHRTFKAMWDEDGPYDWRAEIDETLSHELEHHMYFLSGDDPMDEAERAEIADEAARVVGKKELARKDVRALGAGAGDFLRRTWVLWLVLVLAMFAAYFTQDTTK